MDWYKDSAGNGWAFHVEILYNHSDQSECQRWRWGGVQIDDLDGQDESASKKAKLEETKISVKTASVSFVENSPNKIDEQCDSNACADKDLLNDTLLVCSRWMRVTFLIYHFSRKIPRYKSEPTFMEFIWECGICSVKSILVIKNRPLAIDFLCFFTKNGMWLLGCLSAIYRKLQIAILEVEISKMYRSKFSVFIIIPVPMYNFFHFNCVFIYRPNNFVSSWIFYTTYTFVFLRILIWTQAKSNYASVSKKMPSTSHSFNV